MRILLTFLLFFFFTQPVGAQEPVRLVALGDSLTAGYGLQPQESLTSKLQSALIKDGYNVHIDNAGVSGNTTAQGRARLEQALSGTQKPRLVIVALGANDMLRKIDLVETRANVAAILTALKDKNIPALLVGIHRPSSSFFLFSDPYKEMFKDLADQFDVPLYPFMLKDVALNAALNLPDGLHPNAAGVDIIVKNMLPSVEKALDK